MKSHLIVLLALFIMPWIVNAVKVVECEDAQGDKTYQTACQPGTTQVNEKQFRTGSESSSTSNTTSSVDISAILYMVPDCDSCADVREYLQARNISVTLKDASNEQEIQEELKALNGILRVPVVVIGETKVSGYNRTELNNALAAAGYIDENEETDAEPE